MAPRSRPHLLVAPASLPVSAAEARALCHGATQADDTSIEVLIGAVVSGLDGWSGTLRRCLVTQDWAQPFDRFDCRLDLPFPAQSVLEITYLAPDGTEATVDPALYQLRSTTLGSHVELRPGQAWPDHLWRPDGVTVAFRAGYGAPSDVPALLRRAIALKVGALYTDTASDPRLRREVVEGHGSFDFDLTGAAGAANLRLAQDLLRQFRLVRL